MNKYSTKTINLCMWDICIFAFAYLHLCIFSYAKMSFRQIEFIIAKIIAEMCFRQIVFYNFVKNYKLYVYLYHYKYRIHLISL